MQPAVGRKIQKMGEEKKEDMHVRVQNRCRGTQPQPKSTGLLTCFVAVHHCSLGAGGTGSGLPCIRILSIFADGTRVTSIARGVGTWLAFFAFGLALRSLEPSGVALGARRADGVRRVLSRRAILAGAIGLTVLTSGTCGALVVLVASKKLGHEGKISK